MEEKDKKEIRQIFNEGFEQLSLPLFDKILKDIGEIKQDMVEAKKDLKIVKADVEYLNQDVDKINRKLDAEISWRDDTSKRLKKLETATQ